MTGIARPSASLTTLDHLSYTQQSGVLLDKTIEKRNEWQRYLSSLYWLGGSTCSGKTTICAQLSERFGVTVSHRDDFIEDHFKRANPQDHPAICEWLYLRKEATRAEILERSVDDLVTLLIGAFREDFALTQEDLLKEKLASGTVVEGLRLLPDIIAPLLERSNLAAWLVLSPDLHRTLIEARSAKSAHRETTVEAARLREHLSQTFIGLGGRLTEMAAERGTEVIEIRTMEELREVPDTLARIWGLS